MRFFAVLAAVSLLCSCSSNVAEVTEPVVVTQPKRTVSAAVPANSFAPIVPVAKYSSRQQAKLAAAIKGTSLTMARHKNTIVLTMPGAAAFAPNSYNISASSAAELKKIAPVLRYFDKTRINVVGHTAKDAGVKESTGRLLSEKRADKAASVLVEAGVPAVRFWIDGKGGDQPVATNDTEEGRAENNRIEIILTPTIR